MADNLKEELLRLLKTDDDVRRALLAALATDIPGVAELMRRAHDTYPLRLR